MKHAPAPAPLPVVGLVHELADWAARTYGDRPFLLRHTGAGWEPLSYRGFARAVHAFASLLDAQGVKPGDRVGLQSENRVEWGVAYLGILEAGAIAVPLDAALTSREVGEILDAAGGTCCVVSAKQRPELDAVRAERLPALKLVSLDPDDTWPSYADALARFPDAGARPSRARTTELAALLFTSGTTGQPKGVMLSHSNLLHNVEAVARFFQFLPEDRLLSVLPLHHTFECTIGFLCPLRVGGSVAYARGLKSKELREDLETSGATLLLGVPLLYEKLLTAIHRGIEDAPLPRRIVASTLLGLSRGIRLLSGRRAGRVIMRPLREKSGMGHMRMFVSGAAALPAEVFWGFVDLGWPVLEGYGLTECAPVVVANDPERPSPGAVGWPLEGIEVRIHEPDEDGDGEVVVRGPNVMMGYWNQPDATAEVLRDGWFYTGDLGRILSDGRLRITGRLKNMIATAAGKKIYPEEVEQVLANCPYILEVVVVGGRDARGEREEVHAHVVPNLAEFELLARAQNKSADEAFVESVLRREIEARGEALAPYKRVKRVIVRTSEFPKTSTGKIRRQGIGADMAAARDAVA